MLKVATSILAKCTLQLSQPLQALVGKGRPLRYWGAPKQARPHWSSGYDWLGVLCSCPSPCRHLWYREWLDSPLMHDAPLSMEHLLGPGPVTCSGKKIFNLLPLEGKEHQWSTGYDVSLAC